MLGRPVSTRQHDEAQLKVIEMVRHSGFGHSGTGMVGPIAGGGDLGADALEEVRGSLFVTLELLLLSFLPLRKMRMETVKVFLQFQLTQVQQQKRLF